jgi:protease-4
MRDIINTLFFDFPNSRGHPMPTRLFSAATLLAITALLTTVIAAPPMSAQPAAVEEPAIEETQPAPLDDTVGWLVLDAPLREGPVREAWVSEDEAGPSLRTVLDQINHVAEQDHYLGLVVYLDLPGLTPTQTDAIYQALLRLRKSGKTVVTFAQAYSTADYVLASAGNLIALQHKGSVELSGMHIEEMYLAGLLKKVGIEPNFIQVGKYKGASEQMMREGPSEAWSKNMDGLLDGMYDTLLTRIADGRGVSKDKVEQMMAQSLTLDDRGLLKAGIVDRLAERDLVNVTELEFGEDFVWDTEMGRQPGNAMQQAMAANPMMMLSALLAEPVIETTGPTVMVIHANGAIVSGDSTYGDSMFGGSSIGSRTVDQMLDDALYDDNVKAVVLRLDSPGGSALASEVMWQAIRQFGESKPIVCSIGGMAASGGYYIASACDEIYVEPRAIVGSIGVVAGKLNVEGLYNMVGIQVHTRSRGPNANLLSSVDNFTDEQKEKLRASMNLVYDQFRDRVATGRGARLKDLDAVDEGMLFTGKQAIDHGMADQLGGLADAIEFVANEADLEPGDYGVMELPHPISLAEYLGSMLSGPSLPFGLTSPDQGALLGATRQLVGEGAWVQITRALHGITLLRDEQVLVLMPRAVVVK